MVKNLKRKGRIMASDEESLPIGEPVLRGVVDVAHQTIGVPDQSANLRRQMKALRKDLTMLEERLRRRGRRERSSEGSLVSGPVLAGGRLLGFLAILFALGLARRRGVLFRPVLMSAKRNRYHVR